MEKVHQEGKTHSFCLLENRIKSLLNFIYTCWLEAPWRPKGNCRAVKVAQRSHISTFAWIRRSSIERSPFIETSPAERCRSAHIYERYTRIWWVIRRTWWWGSSVSRSLFHKEIQRKCTNKHTNDQHTKKDVRDDNQTPATRPDGWWTM